MLKAIMFQIKVFPVQILHDYFEAFVCVSGRKFLHDSCRFMSLVNFGTNFSLIGVIKREL